MVDSAKENSAADLEAARKRIHDLEEFAQELEREREVLSKSESEHRIAFEHSGTGMVVARDDMMVIMANQRIEEVTGFPNDEVRHKRKWTDFVYPEDLKRLMQYHVARRKDPASAPDEYEFRLVDKQGNIREVLANAAMIPGTSLSLVSMIDITARKNAERALRESEERFRTIFRQSPIGIALFDGQGNPLDVNDAFSALLKEQREANADAPNLFTVYPVNDADRAELAAGKGINREVEYPMVGEPGATEARSCWLAWRVTPLGMGEIGPSSYLAQVEDITESKRRQEAELKAHRDAAAKAESLVAELRYELLEKARFHSMVSRSPLMREIFEILPEIANASAHVLICGESGTGKELIAKSLHDLSARSTKAFVAINCGALPDTLLESELFGYRAGAFTDAKKDKPGKFAIAEGGTIFFDEIGDILPAMQVKLLRVLQEKTFEPLGGTASHHADVRVIAATNRDLVDMVRKGTFREDLYYRIHVVAVKLPPLRERRCDIPLLCDHFIERFNVRYGKTLKGISAEAMEMLLAHEFPGNIRELENAIEHAFVFCKTPMIEVRHLPAGLRDAREPSEQEVLSNVNDFDDLERMYINAILKESGGSRIQAAKRLGVHKATLFRKLKKLGIQ
jgi:PAS domain S-box-containing protein